MIDFTSKILLGLVAISLTSVSIQLVPLNRQATSWNRCLKKTSVSLSQVKAVRKMDDESREVLSVMICNAVVFETNFRTNIH